MQQLRPLHEWTFEYLDQLPEDEQEWLDYKGSNWLLSNSGWIEEISSYLSAFANFDGGYLIIGMERFDNSYRPDGQFPERHPKKGLWNEWLEDKLPPLVEPTLPQLSVRFVPSPRDPHIGVLVIHVPSSDEAPHQSKDCKYYQRVGTKTLPLRHRSVTDISGRKKHPVINVEANLILRPEHAEKPSYLNLELSNTSNVICERFGIRIDFPLVIDGDVVSFEKDVGAYIEIGEEHDFFRLRVHSGLHPLFPKDSRMRRVEFRIRSGRFVVDGRNARVSDVISIRLFADSAPYLDSQFSVKTISRMARE